MPFIAESGPIFLQLSDVDIENSVQIEKLGLAWADMWIMARFSAKKASNDPQIMSVQILSAVIS
jgi:hypothetical protein